MSDQTSITQSERKPAQREQDSQYTVPGRRSYSLPVQSSTNRRRPLNCGELDLLF